MAEPIYGIKEFPRGTGLWRVVWFGGVAGNPEVASEPLIEVLLAAVPEETSNAFHKIAGLETAFNLARIGVGQLPYVSIGSLWRNRQPVSIPAPAPHQISMMIDTSATTFVSLGELTRVRHVIPQKSYAFGKGYPYAAETKLVAIEQNGDPWAILIPVIELIRFYYVSSTRLAQAFFWGEYGSSINPEKCGLIADDLYRVHLRRRIRDTDAWTLARFHASEFMQRQVLKCYHGIQKHSADSPSMNPGPFGGFECGFPFSGETELKATHIVLPGPSQTASRILVLKLLRCTAPFPFGDLICDRDNRNMRGENAGDINLPVAWIKKCDDEDDEEKKNEDEKDLIHSDEEPAKWAQALVIDIIEDRFADLDGRKLIKEETEVQKYRSMQVIGGARRLLKGFGTGAGI